MKNKRSNQKKRNLSVRRFTWVRFLKYCSLIAIGIIILIAIFSPSKRKLNIEPIPGISVDIEIYNAKISRNDETKTLMYFEYTVENRTKKKISFHPGKIRIRVGKLVNISTYYASLASAMTREIYLTEKSEIFNFYGVYLENTINYSEEKIEVLDSGLSFSN